MEKKIIDIYHGEAISKYDDVCNATHLIIHKGSQGMTMVDKKCAERIKAFEQRNHPYWIYVFLNKGNELDQTKRLVELYKDKVGKHFVGYVLDIESDNTQANSLKALEYLLTLPHKVMFYFSWDRVPDYPKLLAKRSDKCAFWESRYGDSVGNKKGTDRSDKYPFSKYADLAQYTEYGTCKGMVGDHNIDLNKLTGNKPLSWFTTPLSNEEVKAHKEPVKKKYTGEFPDLPPRGYWMLGDGVTSNVKLRPEIEKLQKFLKKAGLYMGEIDGKIGRLSRQAIMSFQAAVGIKVDGFFGKKSLEKAKNYMI